MRLWILSSYIFGDMCCINKKLIQKITQNIFRYKTSVLQCVCESYPALITKLFVKQMSLIRN
jgi:hypothetical protein